MDKWIEEEGEQLLLVSARYRFRCELGAIWQCFEDDFISVCPSGMLHVRTYVCCARCIAFPRRRSAISRELPRRSFAAVHRTAARRFKWVAQTAPAWVLCARARRNWFKPHYTRGHVREGRENNVYDERLSHRNRERIDPRNFASIFNFNFLTFMDSRGRNRFNL